MEDSASFQRVVELFLLRYHGRAAGEGQYLDDEERGSVRGRCYQLLLGYGLDPELRMALAKETASGLEAGDWREELGFVLALELVLAREGNWLYKRIITEEQLRVLEANYPEVLGKTIGSPPSNIEELLCAASSERRSREPELAPLALALEKLFPEGFEVHSALHALHRHAAFLKLDPRWMDDLERFRTSLAKDIEQMLLKLGDRPEIARDQAEQVQARSQAVELIFCIATEAVALRWFRGLSPEEQERALEASAELTWSEEGLAKSMEMRSAWCKDPVQASRAAMDAAESFRQYGESEAALFIYQRLLGDDRVREREKAESHNRMAVIHREEGRSREAFLEFQEAGILWEALKAPWEEAVTSAFVAEGYFQEGKRDKAERYLEEAFTGMTRADEGKEKMARGYFYLAGCANAIGRVDLERRALEKGLEFAQSLEDGDLFVELNDRLMGLPR